jgi:hypothetical protein
VGFWAEKGANVDGSVALKGARKSGLSDDKRAKFIELAESRTVNAIRAIRVIGKLGNKSHYDYNEADVKKIINALNREVEALKLRLAAKGGKSEVEFKL